MKRLVFWIFVGFVVVGMAYVRLAPLDAVRWHQPVTQAQDADLPKGAVRVLPGDGSVLRRVDEVMRALPRTRVLAGSVEAGHITYVTRSAVFGFPDMTTVQLVGDDLRLYARLRYGASDMGVNAERLERVIAALQ